MILQKDVWYGDSSSRDAFLLLLCYSGKMLWFVVCDGLVGSLGAQVCIVHSTCQISSELTFQI